MTHDVKQDESVLFSSFNLPEKLLQSLNRMKFEKPTPIQAQAIPLAMQGRDILGSAQTGTGKTGAFGIPLIARLMEDQNATALILTPTRELAAQVLDMLVQLIPLQNLKTALLIGGEPMPKQFRQLSARPRVVVGTPGRVNDHLARGTLKLNQARFLVLDETDRMLDMGFGVQLDKIAQFLPAERQTMMFSATLPSAIVKLSAKWLKNPERIAVGSTTATATNVKQETMQVNESEKYGVLVDQIKTREGSVIVFVKTKHGCDRMADRLRRQGVEAEAIHGDLKQRQRDKVIQSFRDKNYRVLVATDVAARGLDIPHIAHVINYDLPQCPEDYIHRIGRTARAGAEGAALNLVSSADGVKWRAITRLLNPQANDRGERSGGNGGGNGNRDGQPRRDGQKKPFGNKGGFKGKRDWSNKEGGAARPEGQKPFRKKGPFKARRPDAA